MDPFYRHPFTSWVNFSQTVASHIPLQHSKPDRGSARNGVINKSKVEISRKIPHTSANIAYFLYGNWQYWSNFRALHNASFVLFRPNCTSSFIRNCTVAVLCLLPLVGVPRDTKNILGVPPRKTFVKHHISV